MQNDIPRYALYGDSAQRAAPEFVHCQALFSDIVRQNWKIAPHRHAELHQMVFLKSGTLEVDIDGERMPITGPTLVSIPSDCVHGFGYAPQVSGQILTIANVLIETLVGGRANSASFSWLGQPLVLPLSEANLVAADRISSLMTLIKEELRGGEMGMHHALRAAIALLFVAIARAHASGEIARQYEVPQGYHETVRRFRKLVAEHAHEHWDVAQYASALGTTRKQLGRICDLVTGQSPKALAHASLSREAQRRLLYSNASIKQVGFDLGFEDPSYFSRFFRRQTGQSPAMFIRKFGGR